MIPTGFAGVEAQLWLWMIAMIRPGACFVAAPIYGANFVPVQLRLIVALAVGIPGLSTTSFVLPEEGLVSIAGVMLVASEALVGLALGFAVQAEVHREALSHVHEIAPWHKADDHVGADLAEGPGFPGAGAGEDVGLGVVEDVAGVGFGDPRVVFAEGWVEGD